MLRLPKGCFTNLTQPISKDAIMQYKKEVENKWNTKNVYVNKDLGTADHVFLQTNIWNKSLEPPYVGLFKVLEKTKRL